MADHNGGSGLNPKKLEFDYTAWAVDYEAFLITKDMWDTIEDPLPPSPAGVPAEYAAWRKKDRIALAWIQRGVEAIHHDKVDGCTSAFEAWEALRNAFLAQNLARSMQLQREQLQREMTSLRKKAGE